jgi:hypothetical protein
MNQTRSHGKRQGKNLVKSQGECEGKNRSREVGPKWLSKNAAMYLPWCLLLTL